MLVMRYLNLISVQSWTYLKEYALNSLCYLEIIKKNETSKLVKAKKYEVNREMTNLLEWQF